MTGISQLTGKISEINAEKLGTEHFEVAWHSGARPTHAVWQGKVWTKEQLTTVCGLGSVTGILGANCYHEYYPFIPGISDRNWTDDWLEAQERKENTPKEFRGKEYTVYEAKQRQRQMETAMRAQRQKVKLFQDNGADPDEVMLARAKYQGQLDEYARFSKKMGLQQERERIYLDMQGRVAPRGRKYGQYILAKEKENSIIKSELREIGLKGKINMRPCKLDISKATFDDNHINRERNHNVTLEEAKSYIENAQFSETVWKGRFERYYSYDGVTYVNRNNLQIRTAYKPEQFSKTVQKVMEVLKNHGRQ